MKLRVFFTQKISSDMLLTDFQTSKDVHIILEGFIKRYLHIRGGCFETSCFHDLKLIGRGNVGVIIYDVIKNL